MGTVFFGGVEIANKAFLGDAYAGTCWVYVIVPDVGEKYVI